jgi:O-antigen/teichoic acid export membrane protein
MWRDEPRDKDIERTVETRKSTATVINGDGDPAVSGHRSTSSRTALGNSAILASYSAIDAGVLFLLNLILARYLGLAGFGKFSFALSYGLILSALDPGFQLILTKFVARNPHISNPWISEGLSIRVFLTAGLILLGSIPLFFQGYLRSNAPLIFMVASSELVRSITLSYCALWRGFQVMVWEPVMIGSERLVLLVSCWLLLRSGHGATGVGAAFLVVRTAALGLAVWIFYSRVGPVHLTFRPKIVLELIRESLPLAALSLADRVKMYLPAIVLAYTSGEASVGLFQAAMKIVIFPVLINGTVGAGIFPAMSAASGAGEQAEKLYRYGVRMLWHILLPCSLLTLYFARPLVRLIFGAAYEHAAPTLQILTPFFLVNVIVTMSYYLMTAVNRQMLVMKLALLATATNIVAGIGMMRFFGAQGAAITLLITDGMVAFAYWRNVNRLGIDVFRTRQDAYQWLGFVASAVLCLLLRHYVPVEHWLSLLTMGLVITVAYAVFLLLTDGLLPEELKLLASLKTKVMG